MIYQELVTKKCSYLSQSTENYQKKNAVGVWSVDSFTSLFSIDIR